MKQSSSWVVFKKFISYWKKNLHGCKLLTAAKQSEKMEQDSFFFLLLPFLSHCFSLLSVFLSSKPFRNNLMYCEIIDCYFNIFFVEIQLRIKTWKVFFESQSVGTQTGLNTSLIHFSMIITGTFSSTKIFTSSFWRKARRSSIITAEHYPTSGTGMFCQKANKSIFYCEY